MKRILISIMALVALCFTATAVEFRPTKKFAMSVSLCSLQGVSMEGRLDVEGSSGVDMSGMGVSFDFIANAQVGFKLYF